MPLPDLLFSTAWLCWLGESTSPVQFDLGSGFESPELASFRLISLGVAQHGSNQLTVLGFLRGVTGNHPAIAWLHGSDIVAADDAAQCIIVTSRFAQGICSAGLSDDADPARSRFADILQVGQTWTALAAVSQGSDIYAAATTNFSRTVVGMRFSGQGAQLRADQLLDLRGY